MVVNPEEWQKGARLLPFCRKSTEIRWKSAGSQMEICRESAGRFGEVSLNVRRLFFRVVLWKVPLGQA